MSHRIAISAQSQLQRGRAHVSAETFLNLLNGPAGAIPLQRGRAHVSAETPRAAAASSPRSAPLQRGRAHVSAETQKDLSDMRVCVWASTGPRSRERGNTT